MKVLIVSLTFPPANSATANLIGKLVKELQRQGCIVNGLTKRANPKVNEDGESLCSTVYYINDQVKSTSLFNHILSLYRRVLRRLPLWWKKGSYHEEEVKLIVRAMRENALNDYDAILCVCAYYSAIEGALRYKNKERISSKIALMQVDPLTDNKAYPETQYLKRKNYEKRLYDVCDNIFTTPIIYKRCEANGFAIQNAISMEFPLVCEPVKQEGVSVPPKEPDEIRCVFAGYLYPNIRDAKYALELFSKFSDPRIKLYILGTGQEQLVDEYAQGALKGRLTRIGSVPFAVSEAWMDSADVLVNIGNSVTNQIPSKIFDYISRGKCILNICKSDMCPTLDYLNRYSLSVNVMEGHQFSDEIVWDIENKLIEKSRKTVPFCEIEKEFNDCTPAYVAEQIITALK